MNRMGRAVIATAVVAALLSLGSALIPFSFQIEVQLPFIDLGATVDCGPAFLEMFGDEPCTQEARRRAGRAVVFAGVVLAAGAAGAFVLKEPR